MKETVRESFTLASGDEIALVTDRAMYGEGSYTVTYKLKRKNPQSFATIEKNLWMKIIPYEDLQSDKDLNKKIVDFKNALESSGNITELLLKADNYRF